MTCHRYESGPHRDHRDQHLLLPHRPPRLDHRPHQQHRDRHGHLHLRPLRQHHHHPPTPGNTPAATLTAQPGVHSGPATTTPPTPGTQLDPSRQSFGYLYAGDNPINEVDPTGYCNIILVLLLRLSIMPAKPDRSHSLVGLLFALSGCTIPSVILELVQ
jgi:hypothetical protein